MKLAIAYWIVFLPNDLREEKDGFSIGLLLEIVERGLVFRKTTR